MSDIWIKKWASWGCSIFELNDDVLKGFWSSYGIRDRYISHTTIIFWKKIDRHMVLEIEAFFFRNFHFYEILKLYFL
jgi:hypothetical protein